MLNIDTPIVETNWLFNNLDLEDLVVLDATIPKAGSKEPVSSLEKKTIKNARFFDLKQ
jgi:thiosulfate/3-mercaptopyruvate sulfurtransferase